jgi:choline dehydrogenase
MWDLATRFAANDEQPRFSPAGKVVGGGSASNGTYYVRGGPEDYDLWAKQGNDQWSYEKLLPFFRKIETDLDYPDSPYHGNDGPLKISRLAREHWGPWQEAFYQAAIENGFPSHPDHNHPDSSGICPVPSNNYEGVRQSTAICYLNPARYRPNLNIKGNSLVHRVLFNGKRATAVEVESNGELFTVEADEIVLSAGVFFSPAILMRSGIGPADHLRSLGIPVVHDLPGVGQNLRDHPRVWVNWAMEPKYAEMPEAVASMPISLRFTADGSDMRNDLRISLQRGYNSGNGARNTYSDMRISMNCIVYFQVGSGELKLASRDPHDQPIIDFHSMDHPFDRQRLRYAVRTAMKLADSPAFKGILRERCEPTDEELSSDDKLDEYIQRKANTSAHAVGTCKMGPASDPMAVVDQYGYVHGITGLRVADASIMPHSIRANTNATCLAIGERIADFMLNAR